MLCKPRTLSFLAGAGALENSENPQKTSLDLRCHASHEARGVGEHAGSALCRVFMSR